ncbi:netrin-4-like isoform X3 [Scyliorhinus canicula]|uniref:netrin-4-like isoform X3 n=1 Tax=Scyliorhinus canicula TaxID=7830 RepID=UPI0018F73FAC|nr:netrin-4-like isoform X3 [Scyliorhinus canicula]
MHAEILKLLLVLGCTVCPPGVADRWKSQTSRCDGRSCNPSVGNLATGRAVHTLTTCGDNGPELYCSFHGGEHPEDLSSICRHTVCSKCNSNQSEYSHPATYMTDDSFQRRSSWWQSAQGVPREEVRLDLETEFYLTHTILVFKSPRPAAMMLERSQDHGRSWKPYKYFARNCSEMFGMADDTVQEGSLCTSRYSDPLPCSKGEVHGRCVCRHNTAGDHCERCAPLYNDQPWQPGDGMTGKPNQCAKCQCHGHAESCHFDTKVWLASGKRSGGICHSCQHHTKGRHCQRCQPGYYRDRKKSLSARDVCKPCSCHPLGSTNSTFNRSWKCDPKSGYCYCKPGVGDPQCASCLLGYWGFGESGCQPCDCARACDPQTGQCLDNFQNEQIHNIPIGSRIPGVIDIPANGSEEDWSWQEEQGFSALRHSEKCVCKETSQRGATYLCHRKYTYAIKARILSAHDKGTHAEVTVKVKKVMKTGKVKITHGNWSIYPESWTKRGCTCPLLNPGTDYLIVGHEASQTGRLLVNMDSLVTPWRAGTAKWVAHNLRVSCK